MQQKVQAMRLTARMEGLAEFERRLNELFGECDVTLVVELEKPEGRPCGEDGQEGEV